MQDVLLKKNQQLNLTNGQTITVTGKLGGGGQGIVYLVQMDDTGEEKALKWYFAETLRKSANLYSNLEANIKRGSPAPQFAWPEYLTEPIDEVFGYVMQRIPPEYKVYSKYLLARESFRSHEAMVNTTLNLVTAFYALHQMGYNYQDFNDANFAVRPQDGDLLIFDNDNVMGYGMNSGVVGKRRYMAPELVRGEKMPDKYTDRYSLSLMLFLILVGNHPLEGVKTNVPCLTNKYDKRFFGTDPLFIFDADNSANVPVLGLHQNALNLWPCYPDFIRSAFQQDFSRKSLLEGKGRLQELEWMHLLVQLKSSIAKCPHCGETTFVNSSRTMNCSKCGREITPAGYLRFLKRRSNREIRVPIFEGAALYAYHMDGQSSDYQTRAASVLVKPGKFGLRNESGRTWKVTSASGDVRSYAPGETVVLGIGATIDFGGGNAAEVVAN